MYTYLYGRAAETEIEAIKTIKDDIGKQKCDYCSTEVKLIGATIKAEYHEPKYRTVPPGARDLKIVERKEFWRASCNYQYLECPRCKARYYIEGYREGNTHIIVPYMDAIPTNPEPVIKPISVIDPVSGESVIEGKKGCFIATAVFDSPFTSEVEILREFRDKILNKFVLGRLFVFVYYWLSPSTAKLLKDNEAFKNITRKLLTPLVQLAKYLNKIK